MDLTKVEVITKLPISQSQEEVRIFLVHVSYYRQFIKNFNRIAASLFKLLSKDASFSWDSHYQIAFDILKHKLSATPVLRGPNWSLPFHIHTDASEISLGVVLGQRENQSSYSIYFVSKNLTHAYTKK